MNYRLYTLFLTLVIICYCSAQENKNDSLLNVLDKAIQEKELYVNQKENQILKLKTEIRSQQSLEHEYYITSKLIDEYTSYSSDSAFQYIEKNRILASKSENKRLSVLNEIAYSKLLSSVGLFTQAKEVLDFIDIKTLDYQDLIKYYLAQEAYYSYLVDYNQTEYFANSLNDNIIFYYKKTYDLLPNNDPMHYLYKYLLEIANKNYKDAIVSIGQYQNMQPQNSRGQAISNYLLSEAYRMDGNEDKYQEYLTMSAIEDIKSATKENRAIFELANLLYSKGDVTHSYKYIQSAIADANFYNARFRNVQFIKVLPIIEKAYKEQINKQNLRLKYFTYAITFVCFILIVFAFVIYKQRNKLKRTGDKLLGLNADLQSMSESQKELIELQKQLNINLEDKNKQITEQSSKLSATNKVKDEYVKQFLQMCSTYIEKLSDYQIVVNRKIKTGQINDLLKMTSSNQLIINEKKELLQKFDQAFLRLYPDFIQNVNKLLKAEEKFPVQDELALDNDLRILALLSLGINSSSQIASFLGFTSQTMYTYRTKLRDKAINRDEFDEKITNINLSNT